MRIDAHQHYWKISRGDYGWITPEIPVLYRDFLPRDLVPNLKRHRLDGSIVVQAAPTWEETDYLLSLAEREETIFGVVGFLDPFDPRHREHYERFREHPKFAGFRVMIQEMQDAERILEPDYVSALREYAEEGVPMDLLVRSHQLEPLARLLDRLPDLRGVIDHIGKPRIADGEWEPWSGLMKEIAGHRNIYCKLSGMVTEAAPDLWKPEDFAVYIEHILEWFGPDRVMFGSDWPVCLLAAEYEQVVDVLERSLPPEWNESERARLFGLNAKEFYRL
ncbi:amidohydrolase family protein [Cohnella sp. CFH 77786]|uniref:amidohydrolase family protein n=1 Tax=Cohnella sp. CFH 77786 TaxID=2662265 RepID=UPI001C60FAE9|nr:amidohydrolase family protein [Cohnella sp. CFH 77786]MBW5449085.1 amidohydrolase family protein [Cohnella sp. CFH 77786]